jgi:hypothetical protein
MAGSGQGVAETVAEGGRGRPTREGADPRIEALRRLLDDIAPEDRAAILGDAFARAATARRLKHFGKAVADLTAQLERLQSQKTGPRAPSSP